MSDRSRSRALFPVPGSYVSGAAPRRSGDAIPGPQQRRRGAGIAAFAAVLALTACSGGGGSASLTFQCGTTDPTVICLESCNLGCNSTGCARSDIAQNEIVILQFSEDVDPATVGPSSIRFRTASGEQPVGEFFVVGKRVEFVPTLAISGGQTFFGFSPGETYTMTLPGGDTQQAVVRSTSGKPFERTLTCTLQVTRGIVDQNQVPPRATLVVPTQSQLAAAPLDTEVVLEFNEMVDATPFLSGTQSPVTFSVRRNRAAAGGGFECDPASDPQTLDGTQVIDFDAGRGISILTFRPVQNLPGNVCVEINVTDGVTDLSGRAAQPQTFQFRTVVVPTVEVDLTEDFDDDTQLDATNSAAEWGGGTGRFLQIGGDGRHGAFDLAIATDTQTTVEGKQLFTINTENTVIPGANTSTGNPIAVTDGRFFFSSMVVPQNVRLRFLGARPPVITVCGRLEVLGVVDVVGESPPLPTAGALGQPGAAAGAGGGRGGKGGDRLPDSGPGAGPQHQGVAGEDARMPVGHAYAASAQGTGGRGSVVFPLSGLTSQIGYVPAPAVPSLQVAISASAGGGGGGFATPGTAGMVLSNTPSTPAQMGPAAPGGTAVQLFPFPANALRASEHFLIGGAGGGGSAGHAALQLSSTIGKWSLGSGGAGGGGAVALRAGRTLRIDAAARVLATGGNTLGAGATATGIQPPPAGAGSGGSIVLQTGSTADIAGQIDVRGGTGGQFNRAFLGVSVQIEGGDGAPGFVRFEAPTAPPLSALASMQPAATAQNVGALTERDDLVATTSKYYSTGLIFGPEYSRYEIRGTVDGVPFVLSDDPAVSTQAAVPGAPVRALFQAARLDLGTNAVLEQRPWRTSVRSSATQTGIASDALNGFRFRLLADYTVGSVIVVDSVAVFYRV